MEFKIDAHVHSMYSGDYFMRRITPQRILERAILRGLNGIVITDARADEAFDKICDKPREYIPGIDLIYCDKEIALFEKGGKPIYLLRGMEHHDDKGHLLDIGGTRPIIYNPKYSLLDRIRCAHGNGRIIGCAHHLDVNFGGMGEGNFRELSPELDFVEIFNSLTSPENNYKAAQAALDCKRPGLSNSDDHNAKPGRGSTVLGINADKETLRAEVIKMAIVQGKIIGYHQEYTPAWEKACIFVGKDFAGGHFGPALERIGRKLRRK